MNEVHYTCTLEQQEWYKIETEEDGKKSEDRKKYSTHKKKGLTAKIQLMNNLPQGQNSQKHQKHI